MDTHIIVRYTMLDGWGVGKSGFTVFMFQWVMGPLIYGLCVVFSTIQ
jgi:nitrate reductase NapE component